MHILPETLRSDAHRTLLVRLRFGAQFSGKLHYFEKVLVTEV